MTERQRRIRDKREQMVLRRHLEALEGVEVLGVLEEGEVPPAMETLYDRYVKAVYPIDGQPPCARLPYCGTPIEDVARWTVEVMDLQSGWTYFYPCGRRFVQLRLTEPERAVACLIRTGGGFVFMEPDLSRVMELTFDSRDEDHWLIDLYAP